MRSVAKVRYNFLNKWEIVYFPINNVRLIICVNFIIWSSINRKSKQQGKYEVGVNLKNGENQVDIKHFKTIMKRPTIFGTFDESKGIEMSRIYDGWPRSSNYTFKLGLHHIRHLREFQID